MAKDKCHCVCHKFIVCDKLRCEHCASKLIAAAILHRGVVFTGVRHGYIIKNLVDLGLITEAERPITDIQQGFIDIQGRFWQRAEAVKVAVVAGQVKPNHGTLYSEDLW